MRRAALFLVCICLAPSAHAELVRLDVRERAPYAEGKSFGEVGPYEMLRGVAHFALDPKDPRNQAIFDLEHAPRNRDGRVEFASQFCILQPRDLSKANGAIFYDVNNRGNKLALRFFNNAPGGNDLTKKGSEGDGFLMRRGYTVVWCGWIGELWPGEERLLLDAPPVRIDGKPVRGTVRFEMSSDTKVESLPISRREGHATYTVAPGGKMTLTVRDLVEAPRTHIGEEQWRLELKKIVSPFDPKREITQQRLVLKGGFEPGKLYELIAEVEGAFVQGTGFAAVRDLVSFLRHDTTEKNPVRDKAGKSVITRAHAFGVSQSGRFLRHFLYVGMNEDEKGRIVFEGLMPHVAGGGLGFFNHRFAQPTRHNGQHEDHYYPADVFPFTYGAEKDHFSGDTDSILRLYAKAKRQPRILHTQSAAEYWHRAGSLVHTDTMGKRDAEIPDNVRIYAFGGTQHGPAADPPSKGMAQNLANPADYRPFLRALLDALDQWVTENRMPPDSVYPRFKNGTLVRPDLSAGFPRLPGIEYPRVIQSPVAPSGPTRGIVPVDPVVKGNYPVYVPRSDRDGNDMGTLLLPDVAVPLATYTGWNLRRKDVGAEGQLANLLGSYIPFAKAKWEREKSGDPRLSIEERYASFQEYRDRYTAACKSLVANRYLLGEDAEAMMAKVRKRESQFSK